MRTDVAIIGACPAGLTASISSAKAGAKTAIIEANTSAGRKLLRTGRNGQNEGHRNQSCPPDVRRINFSIHFTLSSLF
jgi:predicted flavoprotein YhiN